MTPHRLIPVLILIIHLGVNPETTGLSDRKSDEGNMIMSSLNADNILVNGIYSNQVSTRESLEKDTRSSVSQSAETENKVEHKVHLALNGMEEGQPMEIRRASLLSLVSISHTPTASKVLSNPRMVKPIVDAIMGLKLDDTPTNLAALALYYILASEVHIGKENKDGWCEVEHNREKESLERLDLVVAKEMDKIRLARIEKDDSEKSNRNKCNGEIHDAIDPFNLRSKEPMCQVLEKGEEIVACRCQQSTKRKAKEQMNEDGRDIIGDISVTISILVAVVVICGSFIIVRDYVTENDAAGRCTLHKS